MGLRSAGTEAIVELSVKACGWGDREVVSCVLNRKCGRREAWVRIKEWAGSPTGESQCIHSAPLSSLFSSDEDLSSVATQLGQRRRGSRQETPHSGVRSLFPIS